MTWPSLPLEEWKDTCATLHMWTQVVGKIRLAQTPLVNHWWNVPLYVSARGLTTTAMPHGDRFFEMEFDFAEHELVTKSSDGEIAVIRLEPKSVATFYAETMNMLRELGLQVQIWTMPVEIQDPIPFDQDEQDRKSTRLNSGHGYISYAVFCLKKKIAGRPGGRGHEGLLGCAGRVHRPRPRRRGVPLPLDRALWRLSMIPILVVDSESIPDVER